MDIVLIDGKKLLEDLESSAWENKVEISIALLVKRLIRELMKGCEVKIVPPSGINSAIKHFERCEEVKFSTKEIADLLRIIVGKEQIHKERPSWQDSIFKSN